MTALKLAAVMALSLAVGLIAGPRFLPSSSTEPVTRAAWKDIYQTPKQLIRGVDAVALVRHVSAEPGRVAVGDSDEDTLQFILNHFTVVDAVKGDLTVGSDIVVEQTGEMTTEGVLTGIDSDGGDYTPGSEYLVFLKKQPGTGYWYVVSFQGRYNVIGGMLYGVHVHDPVSEAIQNQRVDAAMDVIETQVETADF
jgi:hypothetical protein